MINQTTRSGAAGFPLAGGAGLALIAPGVFFLLAPFLGVTVWDLAWPFMIIIPGLLCFVAMLRGGRSAGGLLVLGSVITTIGLILLYQSTFNHFASWSYAWTLIPTAVGAGMVVDGRRRGDLARITAGGRTMSIGLTLFLSGFVFFELLLNIGGFTSGTWGGVVGPLLLIVAGVSFFFTSGAPIIGRRQAPPVTGMPITVMGQEMTPAPIPETVETVEEPTHTRAPGLS